MLEQAFDELIEMRGDASQRPVLYKRLCYLLTAHSVAEENVLYPALAQAGLQSQSDRLYLDQAHAKVMNAMLDMADDKLGDAWLERADELRAAVLEHAKGDEEGDLYPQLAAAIDATTASKLSAAYRREFLSVKPT
jgi:hemerythrin superfamily protein